jgi:hypothetical protein
MGDPPQEQTAHGDVDHGFGYIEAGLVIAHEPAPACHPAESAFYDPAPRQHFEARVFVGSAYDLQHEVPKHSFVEQLGAVIGAIGKQMLEPRPALADSVEDGLRSGAVGDVRRGQIDHQQSSVGIDGDVALATDDLLVGVIASRFSVGRFHRLAVEYAARGAGFTSDTFAVEHERHVVNGLEQHAADEPPEPPVDGLPRAEIDRQHAPATATARQIADRVQHLAQVNADFAAALGRLGQQRLDMLPLGVSQVSRIPLGLAGDVGHPASILLGPHSKLESHRTGPPQPFSNSLLDE